MAIFDALRAYPGHKICRIESAAFSAASYIAMACDEIQITENGFLMIHNPWMTAAGDANELRNQSELLAKLRVSMKRAYASRSGLSEAEVERMMNAESWLDAQQAVSLGFADKVIGSGCVSSRVVVAKMPLCVAAAMASPKGQSATAQWRNAVDEASKTMPKAKALSHVNKKFPGLRERMVAEANKR